MTPPDSTFSKISPEATRSMCRRVSNAYSIDDLRRLAKKRLPRAIYDFYDGGAESESTLRANSTAFAQHVIQPRYLVNVEQIKTAVDLLGSPSALPIAVSPTGGIGFGWPLGDTAIARAAGAAGIPYTLPTSSTSSIERVAHVAPGTRLWFQAYMLRKREFTMSLIDRAFAAGYEVLVLTVDMPIGGKRERDLRNDFGLPFKLTPRNLLDFATSPAWVSSVLRHGMPQLENLLGFTPDAVSSTTIASSVGKNYDPAFDWDALRQIRDRWPRKLLVKGILHQDDARLVADAGCDGVIVSNHGGRQLDGAIASLDALGPIAEAVGDRITVLLDGGVRRGADIVKAIAMGAHAVMVGRPMLYGVCAAGEVGARRALSLLEEELVRTMRLSGTRTIAEIREGLLVR
ncbi:alpha-hydroxy acid oxidase [Cupriavidus taiwanensis]|uniref:alpha-hydroxy acid oxidase n=1 Tax=Cupriavidus taiwanensis TaxID=164546 RepID=UPI00253FB8E7|nr:alpha-hydroxy acid oxidase [Cupriavidus taiwanensis]MDK3022649.1 alpha-hydroxy acid oxidase [Cupriavidus taiwanensis]